MQLSSASKLVLAKAALLECLHQEHCNILSIQEPRPYGMPLMHLHDQVPLRVVIKPLGLLANTLVAVQVEENNLCMVTKNALLQ